MYECYLNHEYYKLNKVKFEKIITACTLVKYVSTEGLFKRNTYICIPTGIFQNDALTKRNAQMLKHRQKPSHLMRTSGGVESFVTCLDALKTRPTCLDFGWNLSDK